MRNSSPLLDFLRDRQSVANLDPESWSLLFAEARGCGLMPRIAGELDAHPCDSMPAGLKGHVIAALRQSTALQEDVRRELRFIDQAVEKLGTRVIYLKGAAYVAAGLPAARGRIFSDIDLLVERKSLAQAEAALMLAGWNAHHLSEYDRRYYREWSHEVPPMTHLRRGTTIDLHHSLVMPTCRIRVDVAPMIDDAVSIPGPGNRFRLSDEDLVLHAASHLLLNSEFDRGLRDLWDIDLLVCHFTAARPDFSLRVLARADQVGLGRVVRRAYHLCNRYFGTPLPAQARSVGGATLFLFEQATSTRHPDTRPNWQVLADEMLLLRELYLRLPSHLLVRHLWHKAGMALKPEEKRPA